MMMMGIYWQICAVASRIALDGVQICDNEKLKCNSTTLRKLCEMCANDMRHTINTLQWVAVASMKTNRAIEMKLIKEVGRQF
ncbi:unnamed protein product [Caenorhabditis bovis]|uniref:NR LBD domain-containing protein n=1 Tax=Caenorhabditis bovis TaxID=2654633 RepID=A0A8S1F173_9PELO|nr:unnamed protein product [Caenorhabditis bovis]